MSLLWHQRKSRLSSLLKSQGDEDAEGVALDRLMHGQAVIGKTGKTVEVDSLRFKDSDLDVVGTLEYGQFGVIDVVTCRLNNCVYVRKSIEKRFALRTRDQCSPQYERDLLLQAVKTDSPWAPHLLCAFQTPTHLKIVMDYAEGGTLWDVLESSPHDGRIVEADLMWWAPQIISAIHWCHSQGFVHRDIKPHNFVLTPEAHILLIDFGSAAPLLPPKEDGTQLIPKRHCLVPCGTCDYISPEILQAHEEALVALEMEDEETGKVVETEGYGLETDWWSLGAMLYEMAYGVAPFFANDIRQTYVRIINHEKGLRFDQKVPISHEYQHFLRRLLTNAKQRLGRRNVMEITDHPLFEGIDWSSLPSQSAPPGLHLPQFTYAEPKATSTSAAMGNHHDSSDSLSQGFAFSALFQSSSASPGLSVLRPSPGANPSMSASRSLNRSGSESDFIGFSWGPTLHAFPEDAATDIAEPAIQGSLSTPRPLHRAVLHGTPLRATSLSAAPTWMNGTPMFATPRPMHMYSTPLKPYAMSPYATLPRTSTVRRTAPRRVVSDREAMKQLVECVGMSARKKVLESGRKPKILGVFGSREARSGGGASKANSTGAAGRSMNFGTLRKELRFDRFTTPIPGPDYSGASSSRAGARLGPSDSAPGFEDPSDIYYHPSREEPGGHDDGAYPSSESTDSEGGGPPSPSPSPRPGSAMSVMSMTMMSRRSATPTVSGHFSSQGMLSGRARSGSMGSALALGDRDRSVTTTMATMTSNGTLNLPSRENTGNGAFLRPASVPAFSPPSIPRTSPGHGDRRASSPPVASRQTFPTVPPTFAPDPRAPMSSPTAATPQKRERPTHVRHRSSPPRAPPKEDELCRDVALRDLERRHALLMQDIDSLEDRFSAVTSLVSGH